MPVAAGVHHQRFAGAGAQRHRLMAEASQSRVLHHRPLRPARIDLHHPAVLVARQAEGIAQTLEALPVKAEGSLGRGGGAAVCENRFHYMALDILLGGEHRSPGCLAAATVGEGANHLITKAVVVAQALPAAEHSSGGTAAAQPFPWVSQSAQPTDAAVEAARAVSPPQARQTLDLGHTDSHIQQSCRSDLPQGRQKGIPLRQAEGIHLAAPPDQPIPQFLEGQLPAQHRGIASAPRPRADVLEVHRQQRPLARQRREGHEVVVETEVICAQPVSPAQHQIAPVPGRQFQPVLQGHIRVGLSLLFGPQSISGKGDGPPQWQKGPGRRCSGRRASHCPGPADREPGPYAEQVQQQGAAAETLGWCGEGRQGQSSAELGQLVLVEAAAQHLADRQAHGQFAGEGAAGDAFVQLRLHQVVGAGR